VIISNDDMNKTRGDVIVAFISSKIQRLIKDTDFIMEDTASGFSNTGLKQ
jgi:mRNA-degrading endonuclease toxin of MazEF toxin-antitoxin module